MPTYVEILDAEIAAEQPVTVSLMTRLRDNTLSYWGAASGVIAIVGSTAAPLGWTKLTNIHDYALRVSSGAGGGTGGNISFTSAFGSRTPTGTNAASSISGNVTVGRDGWGAGAIGGASGRLITSNGNNSTDGDFLGATVDKTDAFISSGTAAAQAFTGAAMNFAVQYVDVIRVQKD